MSYNLIERTAKQWRHGRSSAIVVVVITIQEGLHAITNTGGRDDVSTEEMNADKIYRYIRQIDGIRSGAVKGVRYLGPEFSRGNSWHYPPFFVHTAYRSTTGPMMGAKLLRCSARPETKKTVRLQYLYTTSVNSSVRSGQLLVDFYQYARALRLPTRSRDTNSCDATWSNAKYRELCPTLVPDVTHVGKHLVMAHVLVFVLRW